MKFPTMRMGAAQNNYRVRVIMRKIQNGIAELRESTFLNYCESELYEDASERYILELTTKYVVELMRGQWKMVD